MSGQHRPSGPRGAVGWRRSPAYARVERLLSDGGCAVLDGGVATELERDQGPEARGSEELWGTWALYQAPQAVLRVHRRYAEVGCDVVSTNTWSILTEPELELRREHPRSALPHWMDAARLGVRLARQAVTDAGREGACAVAFAVSGEVINPEQQETVELLLDRVFDEDPPDLILMETLSLIRDDLTFATVERLLGSGLPVWLSFRRCRHGVCGVYGQHWGGPEGDLFGRAARRFAEMGVGALMINCLPVDHVPGMIPWLRDFTDLPIGVYPNLGYLGPSGWKFDDRLGPQRYAELAIEWREEGARIIGGCCGVTPAHMAAARQAINEGRPARPSADDAGSWSPGVARPTSLASPLLGEVSRPPERWRDHEGVTLYPLPFPELGRDPGVFAPTQGSLLMWRYLFRSRVGRGLRCLDMGCGTGILAIQLALNGAERVHAIDIDRRAVANTLANAFRNGVSDRVTGAAVDIYHWEPEERFDVIVASLYQMPVDPFQSYSGHRPLDYWGRNVLDHFLHLLPQALDEGGRAYVMQLSIISQMRTAEILERLGLQATVVDFHAFAPPLVFEENGDQIARVEQLSDAFHISVGGEDHLVAYALEITRAGG